MQLQQKTLETFLGGSGRMGRMIREFDWSETPVGPIQNWPLSLTTTVRLMLNSRYPMFIWWGEQLTILYNDAYAPIFGKKHPGALGQPARQVWAEIWKDLAAQVDAVMREGHASWNEEVLLFMERNGFPEEVYFTWSYSPIIGEAGAVSGLFCACTEETSRVLGRRRLKILRDLGERSLTEAKTAEQACHATAVTLAENPNDFPIALIYLLNDDGQETRCCEVNGLPTGTKACPATIRIGTDQDVWDFWHVIETGQAQIVENLEEKFGRLPAGAWVEDHTRRAMVLPLKKAGRQEFPTGFLIAGISPRLLFDDEYRSFLELAAKQLATAIDNARAYEEERKRAEALAELDRAKTVFFSNISHEFRTPLTLMLGPVEDILSQWADRISPHDRQLLAVVQRNGLRLQKLVSTLLDFSRIEAGRIHAAYEPTDLSSLTAELASNFRSACQRAGLELVVHCDRLPELIYVDRDMWEKIVLNLISNAFKYTLSGEIEVSLRHVVVSANARSEANCHAEQGEASAFAGFSPAAPGSSRGDGGRGERISEEWIELSVRDTGIGIQDHELPKIFQRFYRIESARGRTHEGTGIGLALVQELVKLHGGTIAAESVYGSGSRFTVRVPVGCAHLPPEEIRAGDLETLEVTGRSATAYVEEVLGWLPEESGELRGARGEQDDGELDVKSGATAMMTDYVPLITDHSPPSADPSLLTARPRVLVADDNADMRNYVRRLLASHYRVEVLSDGAAALAAARRQRPDLMIIDVMMPIMDGFALLRAVRDDDNLKTVPVIMLSARAGEEARMEGMNAGADDYIVKPFSSRELLVRVDSHLQLHRVRQETQRSLQQRTAQFESLLNAAPLGVYLVDNDLRIRQVNPTALPVFGDVPNLIGRNFDEVMHILWLREYAAEVVRKFRHTLETGEPHFVPERMEKRLDTGAIEYYEWQIHRIPLPEWTYGVVCYFRDISAQVAARQRIAESEERFRAIVSQMTAGISRADLTGKLLFANQKLCDMIGYTEADLIGKTIWELTFSQDVETNKSLFQKMMASGAPFELEKRLIRKDGALIWTNVSVSAIRDASGRPQSTVAVTIDITERKRAEEALRDSEEKYRSLFESIDEGFCVAEMIFDLAGKAVDYRFVETNAVFERQTGLHKAKGRTARELVPELEQWWIDTYGKVALSGQSVRFQNHSEPMNRWFDVYASRIGGDTSRKVAIVFNDITERKLAEAALREADRRKDEFIAMLGHELRNPLGIISNAVHLLRRLGPPDPQLVDLRDMIDRQVTHTSRMLDDLLDVSRISRGKIQLDKQAWDLRDIVRQTAEDYESTLEENGVGLELDMAEQPVRIIGDRTRLSQAIGNLLHNACKFTQPGGAVRVILETTPDESAILEVQDNGMGMEPEVLAWVFEPFSQAERSLERSRGGLGLGLSLVKGIIELHGGTVSAASDGLGRGSEFTIRLPLDQVQSRPAETPRNEDKPGRLWRILIIEDNPIAARSTRLILETMGHTVEVAHSGPAGVEAARRTRPEIVLCDIGLPGLDGYGVASALRKEQGFNGSLLIAVSGDAHDEQRAREAGFNAHLLKPVDFSELGRLLEGLSSQL